MPTIARVPDITSWNERSLLHDVNLKCGAWWMRRLSSARPHRLCKSLAALNTRVWRTSFAQSHRCRLRSIEGAGWRGGTANERMVGVEGFEPPTLNSQSSGSTKLSYTPKRAHPNTRIHSCDVGLHSFFFTRGYLANNTRSAAMRCHKRRLVLSSQRSKRPVPAAQAASPGPERRIRDEATTASPLGTPRLPRSVDPVRPT
jgi:hypothetical protein